MHAIVSFVMHDARYSKKLRRARSGAEFEKIAATAVKSCKRKSADFKHDKVEPQALVKSLGLRFGWGHYFGLASDYWIG